MDSDFMNDLDKENRENVDDYLEKIRKEAYRYYEEVTIKAILEAASTGEVGDGKIFVMPVETVCRIRTGERDKEAI